MKTSTVWNHKRRKNLLINPPHFSLLLFFFLSLSLQKVPIRGIFKRGVTAVALVLLTLNRLQMLTERRGQECKRPDGGQGGSSERRTLPGGPAEKEPAGMWLTAGLHPSPSFSIKPSRVSNPFSPAASSLIKTTEAKFTTSFILCFVSPSLSPSARFNSRISVPPSRAGGIYFAGNMNANEREMLGLFLLKEPACFPERPV